MWGEAEGDGKGILVYFSQLFCDLKKKKMWYLSFCLERKEQEEAAGWGLDPLSRPVPFLLG